MAVIEDLNQTTQHDATPEVTPAASATPVRTDPAREPQRAQGLSGITRFVLIPLVVACALFLVIWPIYSLASTAGDVDIADLSVNEISIDVPAVIIPPAAPAKQIPVSFIETEEDTTANAGIDETNRPASAREVPIPGQSQAPLPVNRPIGDPAESNLNIRFSLPHFSFESGSNEPTADAKAGLVIVGQYLKDNPQPVVIASHTDSGGDEALNLRLSQERADLVKERLIAIGVDGDQITAIGYGESSPVESNDTPEGQAANRRVEFLAVGTAFN